MNKFSGGLLRTRAKVPLMSGIDAIGAMPGRRMSILGAAAWVRSACLCATRWHI